MDAHFAYFVRINQQGGLTRMPTNEEFEQAEEHVDRWLKGRLEGQSYMAQQLCPLIEQLCRDLNEAHSEILRQQGVPESDYNKYDWPEWTNQANSIRWAEDVLKKKLAKTDNWTRYPATVQCADCFAWIGKDANHTCGKQIQRNKRHEALAQRNTGGEL